MPQSNNQFLENLFNPNTGESFEGRIDDIEVVIDTFKDDVPDNTFIKKINDTTMSGVPASNDFSSTTNDLVIKTAGRINTNKISIGDSTSTLGDINLKKTSGNSEIFLISPSSNIPRLYLIRNGGSDTFGGDGASDWTIMNQSGNMVFERGNAFLSNGYLTPFRVTFYNTIELNYYNSGAVVDVCPLRHYRQISGNLNNYYVDIKPSTNVVSQYTQLLPAESGTYITDATPDYIDLNTMKTNINALTSGEIIVKGATDNTFTDEAFGNNFLSSEIKKSSLGGVLQTQLLRTGDGGGVSFQNSGLGTFSSISHGTNSAINSSFNLPKNAGYILTEASITDLEALRTSFNAQTNGNILLKSTTDTFSNIGIDNGFGSGSLIVQKDSGTIKSQNFLTEQAGTGYMFESFSNPAIISYLYHGTNSGLGAAVEMPSTSGQLGLTSQIAWNISGSNITTKGANDNVGIGNPSSLPSRLTFQNLVESKICLYGNSSDIYGFGVSNNQLNYHVISSGDRHVFYAGGTNGNGSELMRIQGNKQIFLGESGGDGIAGTGDVIISNRNDSTVEIELRSDDVTLSSPHDWLIGKIQGGWTSGSYADAFIKFQTHFTNNTTLNDLLTLKGQTATLDGTLNVSSTATFQGASNFENTMTLYNGSPNLILRDTTDSDDIQVRFDGLYGGVNVTNARITTTSNYLNLETTNNAPMNGLILKTNLTNALTIDNNQNVEIAGGLGIGKTLASGFALDVDGTNPSIFRGNVGIGAVSPIGNLDVNGAIVSTGSSSELSLTSRSIPSTKAWTIYSQSGDLQFYNQTTAADRLTINSNGNVGIGAVSGGEKLEVTGNVKIISGILQVDELQGTLGSSTKIDLNPGGGNIDLVVPNSAGGISPNVDINFKTDTKVRMNLNSIDGVVFHENFIFKNTTGSTYFPLSFNGAIANSLNVGTDLLNVSSGNVEVQSGTSTSGVYAEVGIAKIGNGITNYAMFSHTNMFSVAGYALLQSDLGETFLNCLSGKNIWFRINNQDIGLISDTAGAEKTEFYSHASSIPEFNSSGQVVSNFVSVDNPVFRVHSGSGTQNNRCVMYTQVVVNASTTPFTQQPLELQDYGTQPGYVTNAPGFAFRVCDPLAQAEIYCSFSGYSTAANALQTIKLQLYAHKTDGTKAWVDIASYDFFINEHYEHLSHSFFKRVTFTYSYYSFARFVLVGGTFTGDTGDSFFLVIQQLPRQTR